MRHGGGQRGAAHGLRLIFERHQRNQRGFFLVCGGLFEAPQPLFIHDAPPAPTGWF